MDRLFWENYYSAQCSSGGGGRGGGEGGVTGTFTHYIVSLLFSFPLGSLSFLLTLSRFLIPHSFPLDLLFPSPLTSSHHVFFFSFLLLINLSSQPSLPHTLFFPSCWSFFTHFLTLFFSCLSSCWLSFHLSCLSAFPSSYLILSSLLIVCFFIHFLTYFFLSSRWLTFPLLFLDEWSTLIFFSTSLSLTSSYSLYLPSLFLTCPSFPFSSF